MRRVLLLPLDARPCCLQFVQRLADIGGVRLMTPPETSLGRFLEPGQPEALIAWYEQHCRHAEAALVSLDMLAFGGLVASRRWEPPFEEAMARLQAWRELARGHCPVWAFQSVLRTAPTQTSAEELRQAQVLVELSTRQARRALGEAEDERVLADLEAQLPRGTLLRYQETRERNHRLNAQAVEWSRQGELDGLLLGIDDSKTMGWNVLEVRRLAHNLPKNVWIAPGTDETAQLLLARLCHQGRAIRVHWSHPGLPEQVTKYEDRCLGQLVEAQMRACGLASAEDSPWHLFIYGRPGTQGEAEEQTEQAVSSEFLKLLSQSLAQGRRVMLADVAHANGGDVALGRAVAGLLDRLLGYAAWNTAGNTLGTSLACLGCAHLRPDVDQRLAEQRFARERWLDDLVYQSIVRPQLKSSLRTLGLTLDAATLAECEKELPLQLKRASAGLGLEVEGTVKAFLPWSRLFEVAVELGTESTIKDS